MTSDATPGPLRDDPLPDNPLALAAEIRALAAERRKNAAKHHQYCKCAACKLHRRELRATRHAA